MPKYTVGQKVRINPVNDQSGVSARDSIIDPYAGQIGEIVNYYWINPRGSELFYIYTVRIGDKQKEIALHEDEIESSSALL